MSGHSQNASWSPEAVVAVFLIRASNRPYFWDHLWNVDTMPEVYGVTHLVPGTRLGLALDQGEVKGAA